MSTTITDELSGIDRETGLPMLTREQANERRLSNIEKIAMAQGYSRRTLGMWRDRFEQFPQPVAVMINKPYRRQRLYDVREFIRWIEEKQFSGEIRWPAKKSTNPRH